MPLFVGRAAERDWLDERLSTAVAGRPSTVVVDGPPGIGKSALVSTFLDGLRDVRTLNASGDESEAFLQFGIVRQLLGTSDGSWEDPFAAGAAVLQDLDRLGDRQATVLAVDDAHLADAASLGALTFALRRLAADPVLAIFVTRDDQVSRLPPGLLRLADAHGDRLRVDGLSETEVVELVQAQGLGPGNGDWGRCRSAAPSHRREPVVPPSAARRAPGRDPPRRGPVTCAVVVRPAGDRRPGLPLRRRAATGQGRRAAARRIAGPPRGRRRRRRASTAVAGGAESFAGHPDPHRGSRAAGLSASRTPSCVRPCTTTLGPHARATPACARRGPAHRRRRPPPHGRRVGWSRRRPGRPAHCRGRSEPGPWRRARRRGPHPQGEPSGQRGYDVRRSPPRRRQPVPDRRRPGHDQGAGHRSRRHPTDRETGVPPGPARLVRRRAGRGRVARDRSVVTGGPAVP